MKHFLPTLIVLAITATMTPRAMADAPDTWMVVPDKQVVLLDSNKPGLVDAQIAKPLWGAPWVHVDGMLRGSPSSLEEQAKKKSHNGANPRLVFATTPAEYCAQFSIRFLGGEKAEENELPLIDLGHHVSALNLGGEQGVRLTINRHSLLVAQDESFKLENGKTYHFQIEVKGPETLIRIKDGPTLYANNEFLDGKKRTIGLAGAMQGTIEIDDFAIWSVKDSLQEGWSQRRDKLPVLEPVQLKEPPTKKKKSRKSKKDTTVPKSPQQ